jgi:hypothetical protein
VRDRRAYLSLCENSEGVLDANRRSPIHKTTAVVCHLAKVDGLPARNPNLNAFAERFVLSIKRECLDRMVPLGERHLRRAVSEFVAHYHAERNHQGLENRLIEAALPANTNGRVLRRERLGGLLNFYRRAAA